ncbi:DUF2550 domain-containing protein [Thalassiella azotivora]
MDDLVLPLWAVIGPAAALVLVVLYLLVRRVALTRSGSTFDCSVRAGDAASGGGWTTGVASYGHGELRWFRLFSLRPGPGCTWRRTDVSVREFREPERDEVFALLPGSVVVTCVVAGEELQLAMSGDAYTGFASWVEAAPPGQHAHVT